MKALESGQFTAFEGFRRIASGSLLSVGEKVKQVVDGGSSAPILIFNDETGEQVPFQRLPNKSLEIAAPQPPSQSPSGLRGAGRPRLGVVAREVTLLPRHWEWLSQQPGGASAALRRLIEKARRENVGEEKTRAAREALYRFMTAMAGNASGYEESLRALFAGEPGRFAKLTSSWSPDVNEYMARFLPDAFPSDAPPMD